jgi:electron transport complex protein RnfC
VLNGAECEPWICCDDALLREQAEDVLLGARVLMHALTADACVVAIEDDKPQAIAAVRAGIAATGATGVEVQVLPAIYPQGAERQLVTAVTGDEVPSRRLPAEIGVTCQNVATAAAIARWMRTGEPCVSRVVTVTGNGVGRPCNVRARIGTPLVALVEAAGGYRDTPLQLIAGGNMTGRALPSDEIGLAKAMNCVLVATHADLVSRTSAFERPCIRCGDCAVVCPAGLLPQQLHRAAVAEDEASLRDLGLWDCIDCGCCDYVCPSQIPLAHRFRIARGRLREREDASRQAAAARERHERRERRLEQAALAEQEAFEAARRRALGDGPATRPDPPDREH